MKIAALLGLLLVPIMASSEPKSLCHGFVPENNLRIPVRHTWAGGRQVGITEAEFNGVIDKFLSLYEDDFKALGEVVTVNRGWDDPTVNASAELNGNTAVLNMYGGLARHETITRDAFALVICHEAGHHLGGAPKYAGWMGDDWASNEGEADYYAGLKCLRRFFKDEMKGYRINRATTPAKLVDACRSEFKQSIDQRICVRSSLAGLQVARLFKALRKETVDPSFDTPDTKVVTEMFDDHPGTQCRLDTYFGGASCKAQVSDALDNTDYKKGACATENGATAGVRPLCWFKPGAREPSSNHHVNAAPRTVVY